MRNLERSIGAVCRAVAVKVKEEGGRGGRRAIALVWAVKERISFLSLTSPGCRAERGCGYTNCCHGDHAR